MVVGKPANAVVFATKKRSAEIPREVPISKEIDDQQAEQSASQVRPGRVLYSMLQNLDMSSIIIEVASIMAENTAATPLVLPTMEAIEEANDSVLPATENTVGATLVVSTFSYDTLMSPWHNVVQSEVQQLASVPNPAGEMVTATENYPAVPTGEYKSAPSSNIKDEPFPLMADPAPTITSDLNVANLTVLPAGPTLSSDDVLIEVSKDTSDLSSLPSHPQSSLISSKSETSKTLRQDETSTKRSGSSTRATSTADPPAVEGGQEKLGLHRAVLVALILAGSITVLL